MDGNSPDKNDRKVPKNIAALVNEGRFSYPYIPTGIYAEIRSRIARWLSTYFLEYKDVTRFGGTQR